MWQDQLFFFGAALLNIAFLPALFTKQKPPKSTCWLFSAVIASWAFGFYTLGLYWSVGINIIGAGMWLIAALQRRY